MSVPTCPACNTELAPALLACPRCGRLVHGEELKQLADEAERASREGRPTDALAAWRLALERVPAGTRQADLIREKIAALGKETEHAPRPKRGLAKGATAAGALGLVLAKFKFAIIFLLTKAKLLLLGLTKAGTFLTMLLSFSVYWAAWGWAFALGLVVSIYVHEMGHVATLRRLGFKATAPMFVPGLGALVLLRQHPTNPREDARIGLAGPIWGLGAASAAYLIYLATQAPIWAAIGRVGAWINLFNLLPIWQLDGGRGFRALDRRHRWLAAALLAGMWLLTSEGLLLLLALTAAGVAGFGPAPEESDRTTMFQYCGLVVVLALMSRIQVPAGLPR